MTHLRGVFMKHKQSIKSRLSSFRKKRSQPCARPEFLSLENLNERRTSCTPITVPDLRQDVHCTLLQLTRLMRTRSGCYLNLEADSIENAQLSDQQDCNSAFLWAAYTGQTELMERLHQEHGADIAFAHPQANFNALHLAALCGSTEAVLWLLNKNCPIQYTIGGLSPMHFAAYGKSVPICNSLSLHGCHVDGTVLHAAAYAGDLDCAAYILGITSLPNEYDDNGHTALHVAIHLGNYALVKLLLDDPRVDVNSTTSQLGYTALHLAAENGYANCVEMLLYRGASVDTVNSRGQRPLQLCCKHAFIDCVQLLLEYGVEVNAQDHEERSALHAAVSKSPWSFQIVRKLVEHGADVNQSDKYGYTCLHIAALNELEECVDYLIMQGASVAARTEGERSALNIICRKTPACVKTIARRLDLAMSYKEQNLKLNFRDILRNSQVGEIGFLRTLLKEGQSRTLEHPLCQAFLHLKWQKVRAYIIVRAVLLVIAALLLSFYVLVCIRKGCQKGILFKDAQKQYNLTNSDNCTEFTSTEIKNGSGCFICPSRNNSCIWDTRLRHYKDFDECLQIPIGDYVMEAPEFIKYIRYFIFFIIGLNFGRNIFTWAAYRTLGKYFKRHINILELVLSTCVLTMAIDICWDHKFDLILPVGAGAVLCSWTYLMVTIAQLPFFGTYIAMFNKVLHEFVKMIAAFFFLLVGFTFTFCVLQPKNFENPLKGFVLVTGMMTGELNLDDLLKDDDDDPKSTLMKYTLLGILCLFTILVTIVLMNLLVGLAVNDVEGLRKTADLSELIQQTKLIHFIESSCFKGYFPPVIKKLWRRLLYVWPDSYTVVLSVRPLSPHEKRLPKGIMNAAVEIAVRRTQARYKMNAKTPPIEKRLESMEEQIKSLQQMVANLTRSVRRMTKEPESEAEDTEPVDESKNLT